MPELLTMQDLANGHLDVKAMGEAANGDKNTIVTTRTGNTYPSAERAINIMFQNGGLPAEPFETLANMETDGASLADGQLAMVHNDPANNGLYVKTAGVWVKSDYDPVSLAAKYSDDNTAKAIEYSRQKTDVLGNSDIAHIFESADGKTLLTLKTNADLMLAGDEQSLQKKLELIPQQVDAKDIAVLVQDDNNQTIATLLNNGGLVLAGEQKTIQESIIASKSDGRLAVIMQHQNNVDFSNQLFTLLKNNVDDASGYSKHRLVNSKVDSTVDPVRIPAIVEIPTGLLLVYNDRVAPYDGDNAGARLMQRFVDINNNKVTAVSDAVLVQAPTDVSGVVKHPMLTRANNGNIVMVYDVRNASTDTLYYHHFVRISSNEGVTWSNPAPIPRHPDLLDRTSVTGSTGKMVVMSTGRIVCPMYTTGSIWCIYSDDNGATWTNGNRASGVVADATYVVNEPAVEVLADDSLIFSVRVQDNAIENKVIYRSTDGGVNIVFDRLADDLVSSICASTLLYDNDTGLLLHGTPTAGAFNRTRYRIQASLDDGASFPIAYAPFDDSLYAGYSQLIKYKDSYILVFEGDEHFTAINKSENISLIIFNTKELLSNVTYS